MNQVIWARFKEKFSNPVAMATGTGLLLQISVMAGSFIILKWLCPREMGIWQTILGVDAFLSFLRFGVVNAMSRDYAYKIGKGDLSESIYVVQVGHAYTILTSAIVFLGGLLLTIWNYFSGGEFDTYVVSLIITIYSPLNYLRTVHESTFRAGGELVRLSCIQVQMAVFTLLTLVLVYWYGFAGFLLRILFLAFLNLILLYCNRPVKEPPSFHFVKMWNMIKVGMGLFLSNYLLSISVNMPRYVVDQNDIENLGLFAPIAGVISFGIMIPNLLSAYLSPRQNTDLGRGVSRFVIVRRCILHASQMCLLMIPIAILGVVFMIYYIDLFAPAYSDAKAMLPLAGVIVLLSPLRFISTLFSTLRLDFESVVYSVFVVLSMGASVVVSYSLNCNLSGLVYGVFAGLLIQISVLLVLAKFYFCKI